MTSNKDPNDDGFSHEEFASVEEALDSFCRDVQEYGDIPTRSVVNGSGDDPLLVDYAIGTGANKLSMSTFLTEAQLGLLGVDTTPPYATNLEMESSRHFDREVFLMDSRSNAEIEATLENVIPDDFPNREDYIKAFVQGRSHALTEDGGRARDWTRMIASVARNPRDLIPLFSLLTQDCPVETRGIFCLGGATSTGSYPIISQAFRNGFFPTTRMHGSYHRSLVQLEGPTDDQEVVTIGGEHTSTNAQQASVVELIQEDVDAGDMGVVYVTSKDHSVLAHTAAVEGEGTDFIKDEIGAIDDPVDWDAVESSVEGTAAVGRRRSNYVVNRRQRDVLVFEDILFGMPGAVSPDTPQGDVDANDLRHRYLKGNVFVPGVVSANSADDLAGLHDAEPRPDSLESTVRAAVRMAPWWARGPLNINAVDNAVICVAVAGEQTLTQADLHPHVVRPAADEVGLATDDVTAISINNLGKNDLPDGPHWVTVFALFGIDNFVPVADRLA